MHPRMGHRPNIPDRNGPIDQMAPTYFIYVKMNTYKYLYAYIYIYIFENMLTHLN